MEDFETEFFGYNKQQVEDALIRQQRLIDTQRKDIDFLKNKIASFKVDVEKDI